MSSLENVISRRRFIQKAASLGASALAINGCDSKEKIPTGPEPALEQIDNIAGKHIHGAALYFNGKFHFFGGDAIWSCLQRARDKKHEIFDIENNQVISGGEMTPTLASMAYYVHHDQLFALGGLIKDSDPGPRKVTLYPGELTDIIMTRIGDLWQYHSRFPRKIHTADALVLNDKPHIFGGYFEDDTANPYMWVLEGGEWLNTAEMSPVLNVLSNTVAYSKIYAIAYRYEAGTETSFDTRYEYLLVFDGKKFEAKKLPKGISNFNSKCLFVNENQLYLFAYHHIFHSDYMRSALLTYSEGKGWQKPFVFKMPEKLEHYPFELFHGGSMYFFGKDQFTKDRCGYKIQLVPFVANLASK